MPPGITAATGAVINPGFSLLLLWAKRIFTAFSLQFEARGRGPSGRATRERERGERKAGRRARIRAKPNGGREAISLAARTRRYSATNRVRAKRASGSIHCSWERKRAKRAISTTCSGVYL